MLNSKRSTGGRRQSLTDPCKKKKKKKIVAKNEKQFVCAFTKKIMLEKSSKNI
jgi:hypothetical protein